MIDALLILLAPLAAQTAPAQAPAAAPAAAPAPAPAPLPPIGAPISLARAKAAVAAAAAQAERMKLRVAIAVVEPSGSLVAFQRDDAAAYSAIAVAPAKARTAALYRRATLVFSQQVAAGRVQATTLPDVVAVEGGVPIVVDGVLIGAIGVSGATADQDGVIAAAGAAGVR